jgi:hypothetical protein
MEMRWKMNSLKILLIYESEEIEEDVNLSKPKNKHLHLTTKLTNKNFVFDDDYVETHAPIVTRTRSNSKQPKKWSKNLFTTLDNLVDTDDDLEELKFTTPKTTKKRKNMLRSPLPVLKKNNNGDNRAVAGSKPPELILTVDSRW